MVRKNLGFYVTFKYDRISTFTVKGQITEILPKRKKHNEYILKHYVEMYKRFVVFFLSFKKPLLFSIDNLHDCKYKGLPPYFNTFSFVGS